MGAGWGRWPRPFRVGMGTSSWARQESRHCGTPWYEDHDGNVTFLDERATYVSVRQFVADSGAVTRGLRQGRTYTLALNDEPLAKMIPIRLRRAVPREEVLAIFATAPVVNEGALRADLDEAVSQDPHDPYEGTGL